MDPDIDLFASVVAARSFSAAARSTGVSVATVSKRIARLEARLGVRLLNRTTRRVELTGRGELYYRDVLHILDALREAEARVMERATEPQGLLHVAAPTSFGRLYIAPVIRPFLELCPKVDLELNLSDSFDDLMAQGIDVAVRITGSVSPRLTAHRVADSKRVLCAGPDYRKEFGLPDSVEALSSHRLLAAHGQLPWRLNGPERLMVVDGVSRVRTNSSEVVRELALAGAGIALRSLWDVGHDLAAGRLERVLPQVEGASDVAVYLVHPKGRVTAATAAFIAYLTGLWASHPPWEVREDGQRSWPTASLEPKISLNE